MLPAAPTTIAGAHVALYAVADPDDPASATLLTRYARTYAERQRWTVALEAADYDPGRPLNERAGWQVVTDAIAAGKAHGVVVFTRSMVVPYPATGSQVRERFECLAAAFANQGAFLVCASAPSPALTEAMS